MIKAYSDSSVANCKAAATSLLLTDKNFIAIITEVYEDVESSSSGELLGVLQSIRYIKDNCPSEKDIHVFCDSTSILEQYEIMLKLGRVPSTFKYRNKWKELLRVSKNLNVTVEHIKGHQLGTNPNTVCDMLCNSIMRRMR